MPPSDSTATSVVPPPTSTTIEPVGSVTGRPAPIAAAIGSSIRKTRLAPALSADSWIARRSTAVEPEGTQTMICGVAKLRRLCALRIMLDHFLGYLEIGDNAVAQRPDRLNVARGAADHQFRLLSDGEDLSLALTLAIATTDGSFRTIPRPFTWTAVFAGPRAIAMSADREPDSRANR